MSGTRRALGGLDRALRRLQCAVAALNVAVAFFAGAMAWKCARDGYPALAGVCAFLGLAALAALSYWWKKAR